MANNKKYEIFTIETAGEAETGKTAEKIIPLLKKGSLFLLSGGLGAGKSVLIRALLLKLGYTGVVPSPTFTLVNDYEVLIDNEKVIINHLDLYRLESEDDLIEPGIYEMIGDDSIVFAEWGERFSLLKTQADYTVTIDIITPERRRVCVTAHN
jgi:tRNA threonylcarbamoyladenosine biosynthesis protein TsaE